MNMRGKPRQFFLWPLAALLVISMVLSACGGKEGGEGTTSSQAPSTSSAAPSGTSESGSETSNLPPYELTIYFPGTPPKDEKLVEEKINEYLVPKINATLDIRMIDWGQYDNKMNLSVSSREPMDIIFTASWNGHATNVAKGAYLALNDPNGPHGNLLEKYGQDILKAHDPEFLKGAQIKGLNYGVPALKETAEQGGILFRKDIADELGLTERIFAAKTPADLIPILEEVKQKRPDLIPLHLKQGETFNAHYFAKYDFMGDNEVEGTVLKDGTEAVVKPSIEHPRYLETLRVTREMYQKGLINKDAATSQLSPQDALRKGNVFMIVSPLKPGKDAEMVANSSLVGKVVQHGMTTITTSTGEATGSMLAISSTSKDPARAMMFINLLFSDKYLNNLINFGIEGIHFTRNGDIISRTDQSANYSIGATWMLGNQFLNYIWDSEAPDKWEQFKNFNQGAHYSPAFGFTCDIEPVKSQVSVLKNIYKEYVPGLETGTLDLAKADEFFAKLKANGLDEVIQEKQRQLDEFLASKK